MESTQNIKPEPLSAAQPPKIAGHHFQVRSPRELVEGTQGNSFSQALRSNHNSSELDIRDGFEIQRVKKQFAGLW